VHEALAAVHAIEHESLGSELLKMVVALHYGTVIYGNIGAADRLDFTVMQRSASFLVSATQISCNRLALGVLAVGFATAFDGLVGGDFAQDQGVALGFSVEASRN
jgi:hypothetical protein